MVPNSVILQLAVIPLREPDRVEMRARFDASSTPSDVERQLAETISVPTRRAPDITLEELDGEDLVLKISATPLNPPGRRSAGGGGARGGAQTRRGPVAT